MNFILSSSSTSMWILSDFNILFEISFGTVLLPRNSFSINQVSDNLRNTNFKRLVLHPDNFFRLELKLELLKDLRFKILLVGLSLIVIVSEDRTCNHSSHSCRIYGPQLDLCVWPTPPSGAPALPSPAEPPGSSTSRCRCSRSGG